MVQLEAPGQIIILNRTPRSGKSSIAAAIQNTFDGVWMNLGVDRFKQMTPNATSPGSACGLAVNAPTSSLVLKKCTRAKELEETMRATLRRRAGAGQPL